MPKDAPISELTVSRSQILDYLSCGYRWDLSYRRGIAGTAVREAMDLGSAVHMAFKHGILAYVTTKKWTERVLRSSALAGAHAWAEGERKARGTYLTGEHRAQIEALESEGTAIAIRALEHFDLPSWEVATHKGKPLVEMELVAPLKPWKGYRTIPDFVARERKAGKRAPFWLIDWKCRGQMESDDAEEVNLQFATMQYVIARTLPIEIEGSILWQIRSEAPKWPKTNKDGSVSRALIATDWATYSRAVVEAGKNPADYEADMRPKLDQIEWYRTIRQHRSWDECREVWRQIVVPAARRMATDPQIIRRWTHTPFACKGCWARAFCLAELRGDDTEFLLQTDYMDTRNPRPAIEMGERRRLFILE
jgi:hypothetical protein